MDFRKLRKATWGYLLHKSSTNYKKIALKKCIYFGKSQWKSWSTNIIQRQIHSFSHQDALNHENTKTNDNEKQKETTKVA